MNRLFLDPEEGRLLVELLAAARGTAAGDALYASVIGERLPDEVRWAIRTDGPTSEMRSQAGDWEDRSPADEALLEERAWQLSFGPITAEPYVLRRTWTRYAGVTWVVDERADQAVPAGV